MSRKQKLDKPTSYLARVHKRMLKKRRAINAELERQKDVTSKLQHRLDVLDADIAAVERAVI